MKYYLVQPMVAGELGPEAVMDYEKQEVIYLHYVFDSYPDAIVKTFSAFAVAENLKNKLEEINATGIRFSECKIDKGDQYDIASPDHPEELPKFYRLEPTGVPKQDDFGLSDDYGVVVSERVVNILKSLELQDCLIEEYSS